MKDCAEITEKQLDISQLLNFEQGESTEKGTKVAEKVIENAIRFINCYTFLEEIGGTTYRKLMLDLYNLKDVFEMIEV